MVEVPLGQLFYGLSRAFLHPHCKGHFILSLCPRLRKLIATEGRRFPRVANTLSKVVATLKALVRKASPCEVALIPGACSRSMTGQSKGYARTGDLCSGQLKDVLVGAPYNIKYQGTHTSYGENPCDPHR